MIRFPSDILPPLLSLRTFQDGEAGGRSLHFLALAGEEFDGLVLGRMGDMDLVSVGEYVVRVKGGSDLPEGAWVRFRVVEPGYPARVEVIRPLDGSSTTRSPTTAEAALRLKAGLFRLAKDLAPLLSGKIPDASAQTIIRGSGVHPFFPAVIRGLALDERPVPDHIRILVSLFRAKGPDGQIPFKGFIEGLMQGSPKDTGYRPVSPQTGSPVSYGMPLSGISSTESEGPSQVTSRSYLDPEGAFGDPATIRDIGHLIQRSGRAETSTTPEPFQGVKNSTSTEEGGLKGPQGEIFQQDGNPAMPSGQKAAIKGHEDPTRPNPLDIRGMTKVIDGGEGSRMSPDSGSVPAARDAASPRPEGMAVPKGSEPSHSDTISSVMRFLADHAEGLSRYQRFFNEASGFPVSFFPFWFAGGEGSGVSAWWKEPEGEGRKKTDSGEVENIVFELVMDALGPLRLQLRGSGRKYALSVVARAESLMVLREGLVELKDSAESKGFGISVTGLSPLTERGANVCPHEGAPPGIFDSGFHFVI